MLPRPPLVFSDKSKTKGNIDWRLIVGLIELAALVRLYHLGTSPLRGDEGFTIRYWTVPIGQVLGDLAGREPHPLGALLGFGAWKALVGDSEFAMRALPALVNLLGVPALYALGKRLFHNRQIGYVAGLLWALNPAQLWHAQDARDYALWSALSACAFWLLILACDRRRRIDWALYVLSAAAALYMYFTEVFFLLVGTLYIFIFSFTFGWRKSRPVRRAYLLALFVLGLILIPWLAQGWALAHSGYGGTATTAQISDLWTQFLPGLLVGNVLPALSGYWSTFVLLLILCGLLLIRRGFGKTALLLALWTTVPALLLTLAATRLAVFRVDYLLAAASPLLLILAYGVYALHHRLTFRSTSGAWLFSAVLGLIFVGLPLIAYWQSSKAPDWRALRDYLDAHVQADDQVLLTTLDPKTGSADPAFGYYYPDRTPVIALPYPGFSTSDYVLSLAAQRRSLWFVPSGPYSGAVDNALRTQLQLISDEGAGGWIVREYRGLELKPEEIEHAAAIHSAFDGAALRGFSLEQSSVHLTVILFWQPDTHTADTVFIHLIGATNPATGTPLWTQDDHPPTPFSNAPRDIYRLDLSSVPSGRYQIEFGLYDPHSGQRRILLDASGLPVGNQAILTSLTLCAATDRPDRTCSLPSG